MTAQLPSSKEQLLADIAHAEEKAATLCGPCAADYARLAGYLRALLPAHEQEPVGEVIEMRGGLIMDGVINLDGRTYREISGLNKMKRMPLGTKFYTHPAPVPAVPMAVAGFDAATAIRACMDEFPESMHDIVEECAQIAENTISTSHTKSVPAVPDEIEPTIEAIKSILPTSNPDEYAVCIGADMWNACRAAMLSGGASLGSVLDSDFSVSGLISTSDPRKMEMVSDDETIPEMLMCGKHPFTAMRPHPYEMLLSCPPRPRMYCPDCEPLPDAPKGV